MGFLVDSSDHQAALSIFLPITGPSEQVAQGRGRDLGLMPWLSQCINPRAVSWWQAATSVAPIASRPLVIRAALFLLVLHWFCHISVSA